MRKTILIVLTLLMALAVVTLMPAQVVYADVLTDLGFSTSTQDLENYDQRKDNQPFNSKNVTINPVVEEYLVEIGTEQTQVPGSTPVENPALIRSLAEDNNLGDIESSLPLPNNNKYVKAVAVDLKDEGKPHAAAELYYRDGAHGKGELYLSIVDPAVDLVNSATNEILVFSNSNGSGKLISDYKTQHILMNMTAGDFDNDGVSEIVVYIPDPANPRLALYQIENGVIQATPQQTFPIASIIPNTLPTVYMTAGDITGDNLPDLVVSGGSGVSYSRIYVFKSQDFSFAKPQVWSDGKTYYETEIYGAAVTIGKVSGWHEHPIGIVIAGYSDTGSDTTKFKYQKLLYLADTINGTWNFVALNDGDYSERDFNPYYNQNHDFSNPNGWVYNNGPISLACVEYGATTESYYINGVTMEGGGIPNLENEGSTPPDPNTVRYYDYDVIAGNFAGNMLGTEELRIIREKHTRQDVMSPWVNAGLELVTINSSGTKTVTPLTGTTCAALAAPNTDDDSVILKYTGYELQYSAPKILAALASPPYFGDLEHLDGGNGYIGDSSTEISTGIGTGNETHGNVTVTAGAYASLESEISFLGQKITQGEFEHEVTASYAWDISHETETTKSISYGTFGGQDSVALYTIPMDVFTYEVWCPGSGGKGGYWTTMNQCFPYPAAYVVIPADQYDEIASRETGLPRIGGELFQHTLGQPETYFKKSTDMYNVKADSVVESTDFSTVSFGDAYTAQSIEITSADSTSHTFSTELSWRAGAGVAGATIGATFSIGGGGGWATTTTKGTSYTGTLMNMPLEANSGGYSFAWKLVTYDYASTQQNFPVITYAVDQVRRPPLLPQNLEMTSCTDSSATLSWDNVDPNVTGYQLYRYYDFEGNLAGYKKVGDVIPVGTTSFTDFGLQPYTSYLYKLQSIGAPYGGTVDKSILGPECTARTLPVGDAPLIIQQPESVEAAAGSRVVFQVIAQPASSAALTDRIFYQWQRYVDGRWQVLADEEDNLLAINGAVKADSGRYRCAVSQYVQTIPITIYSDPVTLTVNKSNLDIGLSFDPSAEFGDRNAPMTITAGLENTDPQIKPTGKINFVFTYYPDPEVVEIDSVPQTVYPAPVTSIQEAAVINGTGAQITWNPPGYGSYDITAVYLGDSSYYSNLSAIRTFTCVNSQSESASGLSITGMKNNSMTYGDAMDLGATVWRNGVLQILLPDEVNFASSDNDGLTVVKTGGANPTWHLTANRAGSYTLTAQTTGTPLLKVIKQITVNQAQIALKAVDQNISQGTAPAPITLELTTGELKFDDTMTAFAISSHCVASAASPPGIYNIFIDSVNQTGNNYKITGVGNGKVTISGPTCKIKFHGVSNGTVNALVNNWRVLEQNYATGYDIAEGSSVRFSAVPVTGYRVEKWVLNGTEIMKDGSYDTSAYITTNSINQDVTVEVYFVPARYQLTYSAGINGALTAKVGSVDAGSGASLPAQTIVSFTAAPAEGYMVGQWNVNSVPVSDYNRTTYDLTITGNTDVTVSFVPAAYATINYSADGHGQITAQIPGGSAVTVGSLVIKGSDVVFTAVPADANTMVKEWVVNGQVVEGSSLTYTAENIQQDLQVQVVFIDAITYTVNFGAIGSGADALTAEVDGAAIASGDQVRGYANIVFTAHPPEGYIIKQWKLGSTVIQDSQGQPLQTQTYTLENLNAAVTVSVEFESTITYAVDYAVVDTLPDEAGGENGSLAARVITGGQSREYTSGDAMAPGSKLILTAVPDSGYRVRAWNVDGTVQADVNAVYTIDSIDADHDITVEFEPGANPLVYSAIGNGTVYAAYTEGVEVSSGTEIADGTELVFTAVPDDGYQVKEWRYNGETTGTNAESIALVITNGGSVEAEFEREYYTLTLGENLSASVNGFDLQGDQVQGDSSVTVTASAPAGYFLTAWYKDLTFLSGEQRNTYSFTMEQDTEITADFASQVYSVSFTAGENGTLNATADGTPITSGLEQAGGCSLIFTAEPAEGYQVSTWNRGLEAVGGQPVTGSRNETYTIAALSKPEYIRVSFELVSDDPGTEEYLVYFSAGSGGSLSATADGQAIGSGASVAAGSSLVFTAQANAGKTIDAWNGTEHGTLSANKLTFTIASLTGSENVQVTFKSASSGSGGGGGGGLPTASAPAGTLVSSGGGTVSENGATLTFPAGAVEDDIRVLVQEVSQAAGVTLPGNSQLLSRIVEIIKDSTGNFSRPVTITLSIDKSLANPDKFDIQICYYDDAAGKWVPLDNIQVNLSSGQVSGDVSHFTKFAVLAIPKTGQPVEQPQPILDTPVDLSNHWAKDSVMKLMEAGIVSGYQDKTFQPDRTISRAEFTVMLVKALNLETGSGKAFADTASHWAKDSIVTAAAHGFISGYDENRFGPDDLVTREQAAVIIAKAAQLENSADGVNFTDSGKISSWAQSNVAAAVSSGYFDGYPDGSFRPQGNMTRAEAAVIISKLLP